MFETRFQGSASGQEELLLESDRIKRLHGYRLKHFWIFRRNDNAKEIMGCPYRAIVEKHPIKNRGREIAAVHARVLIVLIIKRNFRVFLTNETKRFTDRHVNHLHTGLNRFQPRYSLPEVLVRTAKSSTGPLG